MKKINWVKSLFVKTDKWPTTEVPKEEWNPKNVNLSDYNYDNGNFTPKKSVLEKQKRSRLEVRRAYKPPKTRAQRRVESYADDGVSRPRQEARRDTQKDSGIGDAILLGAALLAASSSSRASDSDSSSSFSGDGGSFDGGGSSSSWSDSSSSDSGSSYSDSGSSCSPTD
jgi:hypothetical protein